jgi:hypothetical protein
MFVPTIEEQYAARNSNYAARAQLVNPWVYTAR